MNAEPSKQTKRFWARMSQAFGKLWTDKHGAEPNAAWGKLIDDYPESSLRDALARMGENKWDYPPSLPIFASFLAKVHAGQQTGGQDFVAGFWRSVILAAILRDGAVLYQVWTFGTSLQTMPHTLAHAVITHVDALTAEISEMERRTGQRTQGMHEHAQKQIGQFLRALRAGSTQAERTQ